MNKNKFIDIVKNKQTFIPEFELSERGQRRQDQMSNDYEEVQNTRNRESELRGMRENDRKQTPEKGVGGKTLGEDEYQYSSPSVTPKKNPMRSPDPKKEKGFYGEIYTSGKPKPTNDREVEILENLKNEIEPKKVKQLKDYIKGITSKPIPASYDRRDLINIAIKVGYENETNTKTGSGIGLRKRIITGRGSPTRESENESDSEVSSGKKMFLNNGKFAISLEKLRRNILHVVYASSRASIPQLKRESISNDVKNILLDILHGKWNENYFNKLKNPDDQRLISTFVRVLKIDGISMTEFDRAFQDHFEVSKGEIMAGNSNVALKQEYKQYIVRGMAEGIIPRTQGLNMILSMSL
jgi:hypothetical protein